MTEKIRIGLIGCGDHAFRVLSPSLTNVDNVEFVACSDVNEVAAYNMSQNFGFKQPYLDYNDMLSKEELDGVMVVTPHHMLKEAAIASIQAGNNVFVEKPMATSLPDGIEIREAARKAGVDVMVGFCTRYAEGRRTMKTLIETGIVGDIVHVNAAKGGAPLQSWRADPEKGGGQLFWLGSHITDQILWMLGSEAERVYGEILWHPETGADQNSAYTIRFKDGVIANVLCSQNIGGGVDFIEIFGSAGRIRAEWPSNFVYAYSEVLPEYNQPVVIQPKNVKPLEMYEAELDLWIHSLSKKTQPPMTVDDGINMLQIIDAVFESGKTGLPVTLNAS